jgi:hypothetical protein
MPKHNPAGDCHALGHRGGADIGKASTGTSWRAAFDTLLGIGAHRARFPNHLLIREAA